MGANVTITTPYLPLEMVSGLIDDPIIFGLINEESPSGMSRGNSVSLARLSTLEGVCCHFMFPSFMGQGAVLPVTPRH